MPVRRSEEDIRYLIVSLKQGLSLNLEPVWLLANLSSPPVFVPRAVKGKHDHTQLFAGMLGSELRSSRGYSKHSSTKPSRQPLILTF